MEDLYNFIVELKEMDLYGTSRQTCCGDSLMAGNCECDDDEDTSEPAFEIGCMFGQCYSWEDLTATFTWIEQ